ncbi:MAG: hypothetical protein IJE26_01385, partial [Oscillospiraceae bacterium]|nr:hypothetical protein [Oscillospiraceae bacterium]
MTTTAIAMGDKGIYLEKLSIFADLLRQEGFAVGLQETADAAQVLSVLDLSDREQVKTALMTVFAKSREEQLSFESSFDNFFLSEKAILQRAELRMEQERERQAARQAAQEDFDFYGQTVELTEAQQEIYVSMSQAARDKLHKIMETWKDSYTRKPELYGSFIHSVFTRTILEEQMRMEDAGIGGMESDPEIGLLYRDISLFQDKDIPKAISMIQTITQQLNGELTAKRRAQISQYAENVYFGKPCGLMDQMASSVGGLVYIDFQNDDPEVRPISYDFAAKGYALVVVNTGGSHDDLTADYSAVPQEMRAVAA